MLVLLAITQGGGVPSPLQGAEERLNHLLKIKEKIFVYSHVSCPHLGLFDYTAFWQN
jgi:hypothetical protein